MKNKKVLIPIILLAVVMLCCCVVIISTTVLPGIFSTSNNKPTETQRNIDFIDTFEDNRNKWTVGNSTNEYADTSRIIKDGKYHWTMKAKTNSSISAFANTAIERSREFIASVDVDQLDSSNAVNYNLLFFYEDENNYYSLKLNQYYQQYAVGVSKNGAWKDLLKWKRDAVVNWEDTNNLKVESIGGKNICYINNQKVFEFTDSSITSGGVAISTTLYEAGQFGEWQFDNFQFKKLK